MITDDKDFWEKVAASPAWREYILPGRTEEEFDEEGARQAQFLYLCPPNFTVIDYGCGVGRVTRHFKTYYEEVIGLDISKTYIDKAKELNPDIVFATIGEYAEKENIAELVVCLMVMQHNSGANRREIINNIHRLLKPGGIAFISFPQINSPIYTETAFVHKFTEEEVFAYGELFTRVTVVTDNLVAYGGAPAPIGTTNEYFLIAVK